MRNYDFAWHTQVVSRQRRSNLKLILTFSAGISRSGYHLILPLERLKVYIRAVSDGVPDAYVHGRRCMAGTYRRVYGGYTEGYTEGVQKKSRKRREIKGLFLKSVKKCLFVAFLRFRTRNVRFPTRKSDSGKNVRIRQELLNTGLRIRPQVYRPHIYRPYIYRPRVYRPSSIQV